MKKINCVKFILDFTLGVVFALLFNARVLGGLAFHEIAGLAIGLAVLVHLILNARWIKNVSCSLFSKNVNVKTRIGYCLNILLLLDLAVIILSGIAISKIVLPNLNLQVGFLNRSSHIASSYIALALIGMHTGLHWHWVMNIFYLIFKIKKTKAAVGYAVKAAAILIFAFGVYNMVNVDYFQNATHIVGFTATAKSEHNGFGKHNFQQNEENENMFQNTGTNGFGEKQFGNGKQNGDGEFNRNGRGLVKGENASAVDTAITYLSIMGAFAVLIYYLEKAVNRKKRKPVSALPELQVPYDGTNH